MEHPKKMEKIPKPKNGVKVKGKYRQAVDILVLGRNGACGVQ